MHNRYQWLGFYVVSLATMICVMGLCMFCVSESSTDSPQFRPGVAILGAAGSQSSIGKNEQAYLSRLFETNSAFEGVASWSRRRVFSGQAIGDTPLVQFKNRIEDDWNVKQDFGVALATFTTNGSASSKKVPTWARPISLINQVEDLRRIAVAQRWGDRVLEILDRLSESALDSYEIGQYLRELEQANKYLPELANSVWNQNSVESMYDAAEIARMNYRLGRRLAVWKIAHQALLSSASTKSVVPASMASFGGISFHGLDRRWVDYLLLPEFKEALEARPVDKDQQKDVARRILSRINSPVLKPEQASFISQVMAPSVIECLKDQASDDVDYNQLLRRLEQYEASPSSYAGHYLNDQYQNMLWSDDPVGHQLVKQLDTHYRNANFRLAVSERLLNRLIPDLPSSSQPVSEYVKGAKVYGQSHISNQMRVNLIPNPLEAVIQLDTTGFVQSDTVARTKTFRVKNQGQASFQVSKQISLSKSGIDTSAKAYSSSSARQNVVGLQSTLDNVPIFGAVARKLAHKKLREDAPETDRLFRRKVTTSAENQIERQVEAKIAALRRYSYDNLLQPLIAMELEPEPLQIATTEEQLVMRYRLAGRDQMAANTSRPRDNGNSLLSIQIHQSTVNNAIARLGLNGNTFNSDELRQHISDVVGASPTESDPDEKEAEFGFASHDPVRMDFKDDRMNVVLNLKTLKVGQGKTWKNLTLTAAYKANVNDMKITLTQDDDLTRIKGRRLRIGDKAAISTVMKKLFKKEYSLNALPEKMFASLNGDFLKVSQFVLSDGWIGISIDDKVSVVREKQMDAPQQRTGVRRLLNRR